MSLLFKKIIPFLILASFLTTIFFGFVTMMHGQDGHMSGDCLLSSTEVSFCPTDAVAMVAYHVSAYHSFLNVTTNLSFTALIALLLLVVFAILTFYVNSFSPNIFLSVRSISGSPPIVARDRKITRWLSLFENSPSFG